MSIKEFYHTIEKTGVAEYKDRGSRFIAHAFPLAARDIFKIHLASVKAAHPKATHYCFAYRIGLDENNFRSGDDGEPAGTAGKPILGQIDSKALTHILIVVVRYFGGSLLGVPGLINAYKTAASLVLQVTPIIQKQVEINYLLQFDYTMMNNIMIILKQYNCIILAQEVQLFCNFTIGVPVASLDLVLNRLKDIPNAEVVRVHQ